MSCHWVVEIQIFSVSYRWYLLGSEGQEPSGTTDGHQAAVAKPAGGDAGSRTAGHAQDYRNAKIWCTKRKGWGRCVLNRVYDFSVKGPGGSTSPSLGSDDNSATPTRKEA